MVKQDLEQCNIYVRNLSPNADTQRLSQLFGTFGKVISCKILYDLSGKHLGRGYVQFDTKENAVRAVEQTCGKLFGRTVLQVDSYLTKEERQKRSFSLYLKGIPRSSTKEEIYDIFCSYGSIKSLYLPFSAKDGKLIEWGYMNYDVEERARVAQHFLDGYNLHGVHLSVTRVGQQEKEEGESSKTKVALSGIHPRLNYRLLEDLIETVVGVYSRKLTMFRTADDRFVGNALFEARSLIDASQLIYNLHGKVVLGNPINAEYLGSPSSEYKREIFFFASSSRPPVPFIFAPAIWLFQGFVVDKSAKLLNCILYHPVIQDPRSVCSGNALQAIRRAEHTHWPPAALARSLRHGAFLTEHGIESIMVCFTSLGIDT